MQEIKEKRHISEDMWIALEKNIIDSEQFMQILEHTCECTWCAERMAMVMDSETAAVEPPSYLGDEIRERTKQLDVQAAVTVKRTSEKIQLLMYSLRVGAAVALSILLLGVTANFQNVEFLQVEQQRTEGLQEESMMKKIDRATDGITQGMSEFANQILNGGY